MSEPFTPTDDRPPKIFGAKARIALAAASPVLLVIGAVLLRQIPGTNFDSWLMLVLPPAVILCLVCGVLTAYSALTGRMPEPGD